MKPLIRFKENLELDVKNWWQASNYISYGFDFSRRVPKNVLKRVKGEKFDEKVKKYLKKEIPKYSKGFKFFKEEFYPFWKKREDKIIKRLEEIHREKFPKKFINIYYTSCKRCPYGSLNKDTFWIQINEFDKNKEKLISIIIHELMHLFFHKYYWNICRKRGLKEHQIADIKESFSVLINEEFKDLRLKDIGYDSHKEIRKYIIKEWKKDKNFKRVLEKTIKYYKKLK